MADWSEMEDPAPWSKPFFKAGKALVLWIALCLTSGTAAGTVAGRIMRADDQTPPVQETQETGITMALLRSLDPGAYLDSMEETEEYPQPEILNHMVQQGETLWEIAENYGTDPESLVAINNITLPDQIRPGQNLTVITMSGIVYTVQTGDSLWRISKRYGVPVGEISQANGLESETLTTGQRLIIPGAKPAGKTAEIASRQSISLQGFQWPVMGPVTSHFGMRWGRMHEGIDIGTGYGANVHAALEGIVTFAGWYGGGYGNVTILDHSGSVSSLYAHLSQIHVTKGDHVVRGQLLGNIGTTGIAYGPHLHFEIRIDGIPQNPMAYLP